jgi:hypothetical protein
VNVCVICFADGVLEVSGGWYCVKHMHHGLHAVAETIVLLATPKMTIGSDDLCVCFDELLSDYDYTWPDDEQEEDEEDDG